MRYIASVSFGKDSLAMLLRLIESQYPLDEVIYYDTGMEFDAIYNNRELVKPILDQYGIQFTQLEPVEPFLYEMLERPIKTRNGLPKNGYGWCGGVTRWGTTRKMQAINRHYNTYGDETIIEYVGIALDERDRINRERQRRSVKLYPLIEWQMTEDDCLQYCYSHGWNWSEQGIKGPIDLYDLLDRVSCWCCGNKNQKELRNIYENLPNYWSKLEALQTSIPKPFTSRYSIFDLKNRFCS